MSTIGGPSPENYFPSLFSCVPEKQNKGLEESVDKIFHEVITLKTQSPQQELKQLTKLQKKLEKEFSALSNPLSFLSSRPQIDEADSISTHQENATNILKGKIPDLSTSTAPLSKNDKELAICRLRILIICDPNNAREYHEKIAALEVLLDRYDKAIQSLEEAITLVPQNGPEYPRLLLHISMLSFAHNKPGNKVGIALKNYRKYQKILHEQKLEGLTLQIPISLQEKEYKLRALFWKNERKDEQAKIVDEMIKLLQSCNGTPLPNFSQSQLLDIAAFLEYASSNSALNRKLTHEIKLAEARIKKIKLPDEDKKQLEDKISILNELRTFSFKTKFLTAADEASKNGIQLINSLLFGLNTHDVEQLQKAFIEIKMALDTVVNNSTDEGRKKLLAVQHQLAQDGPTHSILVKLKKLTHLPGLTDLKKEIKQFEESSLFRKFQTFCEQRDNMRKGILPENAHKISLAHINALQKISSLSSINFLQKLPKVAGKDTLLASIASAATVMKGCDFLLQTNPPYQTGDILLTDENREKKIYDGKAYNLPAVFDLIKKLNFLELIKTIIQFLRDLFSMEVFSVQPIVTGKILHAAMTIHKKTGHGASVVHVDDTICEETQISAPFVCSQSGFRPDFSKLIVPTAYGQLRKIEGLGLSKKSEIQIQEFIENRYKAHLIKLFEENKENWKHIHQNERRALQSIMPGGEQGPRKEEELLSQVSEKKPCTMFCSEFVSRFMMKALEDIEKEYGCTIFQSIFPKNLHFEKIPPHTLKKYLTPFFTELAQPAIVQTLFELN